MSEVLSRQHLDAAISIMVSLQQLLTSAMHSTLGGTGWCPPVAHPSAEAPFKGCIAMRGRWLLHRSCRLSFCWEARQVHRKPNCRSQTTRAGPYREHVLLHVSCPGDTCSQVGFRASRSAERQGSLPLVWGRPQLAGLCAASSSSSRTSLPLHLTSRCGCEGRGVLRAHAGDSAGV